jgi:molecular chaperone DnaK
MSFVNFGIDLGTTNSLIARFSNGQVQVFKNPVGHKETLPSVIAYRNGRIIVGDKAKEYILKDAGNVFASFKRKMGTGENFLVPSTAEMVSPVDLSALVLKELKQFIPPGEVPEAVVITIPASFDTIQSNATKKAGYEAGFEEVLLLQEPVAASLAFFNESGKPLPESGNWLVYDLGGGTFDVALVTITNGELRVADHEGNNFLGGYDFDVLIIEKLLIPKLVALTGQAAIEDDLRNRNGRLEKLFYELLYKAEEAKKELSSYPQTEIEFVLPDSGEEVLITVTQQEFNEMIREKIASTVGLLSDILERNRLTAADISNIIMVGGSTYIPFVREQLAQTGIPLAFDADPTTAVAVGAAYYAGSKLKAFKTGPAEKVAPIAAEEVSRSIKAVFQAVSNEEEELYMALPEGDFEGIHYRIKRNDGGYDSGLKKVGQRISEFLPLLKGMLNVFEIGFYDVLSNRVAVQASPVSIMQGKLNIAGQPLPNDICLEVDDRENGGTKLQVLFQRNDILPLKKTVYKEVMRPVMKGSADQLVINVLEGSRYSKPHSNLVIGVIEIKGTGLNSDLLKGSDVELKFEMSESRDLTITAYLSMTEQEFSNVFSTSEKYVSVSRLKEDMKALTVDMRRELRDAQGSDDENDWTAELYHCLHDAEKLQQQVEKLKETDVTDAKYRLNEERQKLSARYDALGSGQRIQLLVAGYLGEKSFCEEQLPFADLDREELLADFDRIVLGEKQFLQEKSPAILRNKTSEMNHLRRRIYANTRHHLTSIFLYYQGLPDQAFDKPAVAASLKKQGEESLAADRLEALRSATISLSHLLTENREYNQQFGQVNIKGTGIG